MVRALFSSSLIGFLINLGYISPDNKSGGTNGLLSTFSVTILSKRAIIFQTKTSISFLPNDLYLINVSNITGAGSFPSLARQIYRLPELDKPLQPFLPRRQLLSDDLLVIQPH
jgi:hypothetical protein